ncbi:hypothetical protein GIS00_19890 [Nakamurella sp. YIM 132087]|uniref:Helicase-associated domain-containing protein n=1 Tax=Nakamurella alba TaxID=2665158 RepID=A0A7K1FTS0_9ACTN|nr:helicase associated domain-containing protein [Nakamurella alba]MTD16204.1 hypothetical protein [Nakamurella alba]
MNEEPRRQGFRPDDETWARRLQSVVEFVAEHGHLPRQTQTLAPEERRLGYWLSNQRSDLKNQLLPQERAERLDRDLPQWRGRR